MLELDFYKYMGRDHSSPAVESQGHKIKVKGHCKICALFTAASYKL